MELLQKYVSDDLQAEEEESKKMLGLWLVAIQWLTASVICQKKNTLIF